MAVQSLACNKDQLIFAVHIKFCIEMSDVRSHGVEAHHEFAGDTRRRASSQQKHKHDKLGVCESFFSEHLRKIMLIESRE